VCINDDIEAEMVRYYIARAQEYDNWYLRLGRYSHGDESDAAWRADLDAAREWLAATPMAGEIVELAAGTGWWSPVLAAKGAIALYDASPEPLAFARARLKDLGLAADFGVRDAWDEPDRTVDGLFTGFWLSHVAPERLAEFASIAHKWLVPHGLYAFIDSLPDPESSASDHLPPQDGVQVRKLDDGSAFRVRKVFHSASELESALAHAGFTDIKLETGRFFVMGSAAA